MGRYTEKYQIPTIKYRKVDSVRNLYN